MSRRNADDTEEDDEDNVSEEREVDTQPARIGGSHRRPLSHREFPVDTPDFADDGTDPCPRCGKPIYHDGEWCPHCGDYLSREDTPSPRSRWVVALLVGLIILAFIGIIGSH